MRPIARLALVFVVLCSAGLPACLGHQSSSQRLMEAARQLNLAARFGRMDLAAEHTSTTGRQTFLERRSTWGDQIRVVDVNLGSLVLKDPEHAEIVVQYSWTRMDEGVLRTTSVTQYWKNPDYGGWLLEREQRSGGDSGLFGEKTVQLHVEPPGDVHFPTRSLGQAP